ncbi:hypothetical protein MCOR01_011476 [Pyricularia oryzae]|nr:hypothetical protein MCOR01_011476 [Pyricularia oryzae]
MKFFIILFAAMTTSVLAANPANPANPAKPAKPAKPAPPADPCVTIRAACTKSCIGEPPSPRNTRGVVRGYSSLRVLKGEKERYNPAKLGR